MIILKAIAIAIIFIVSFISIVALVYGLLYVIFTLEYIIHNWIDDIKWYREYKEEEKKIEETK